MIKQIILFSLIGFLSVLTVGAQETKTGKKGKKAKRQIGYKVGDTASDFSLTNVDGDTYSLSDIANTKGYIVTFTCNECPYAVAYEQRLIQLHNDMAPKGYPVVAINPNDPAVAEGETFADMQNKASEKGFPFLYLDDTKQTVYPQFGAKKTPHVFLLDQNRVVQYIGAILSLIHI